MAPPTTLEVVVPRTGELEHLELVGWIRDDGDEWHNFRYLAAGTSALARELIVECGYQPVYVVIPPEGRR